MVRWQLAKRRQGTHKAKTRAEVSGGGKKPFKQKGTGNARQGSTRSPLMEGGGQVFAPRPRDYSFKLTKKYRQVGLRSALSFLNKEGRLFVLDSLDSTDGKTKELASRLSGFGAKKAVLVTDAENQKLSRASKNIPGIVCHEVGAVNVFDLLKYDTAIISKESIKALESRCGLEG
tara:strand:- start:281 stop:805 length:525 start_codon:yes stop_codon:yes gene_type:complete